MSELKPCPCGKTPESLSLNEGSSYKWRTVSCECGDWESEFRITPVATPEEVQQIARDHWNGLNRSPKGQEER